MGMEEKECECLTSSRSRDSSLSVEGIVVCDVVMVNPKQWYRNAQWGRQLGARSNCPVQRMW
jgi:hypothetical protein